MGLFPQTSQVGLILVPKRILVLPGDTLLASGNFYSRYRNSSLNLGLVVYISLSTKSVFMLQNTFVVVDFFLSQVIFVFLNIFRYSNVR